MTQVLRVQSILKMVTHSEQPDLLRKVADGDRESMRQLIDRYSGLVWSLVRRKIAHNDDAEDLVQVIFADIWKSAHQYNSKLGTEATFIAVIARRRVVDAIRKKTRQDSMVSYEGVMEFGEGAEQVPHHAVGVESEVSSVIHALKNLTPQRRKALELSIVRGLSHSQIVEATGMPLGTVKAHIRRGLDEIRHLMKLDAHNSSEEEAVR